MTVYNNMLAMLRESRDVLQAELAADKRWQQLQRLNKAIAALEEEAPTESAAVDMTAASTPTDEGERPAVEKLEDRGTNPLVLAILEEAPSRVWKVEALLAEMTKRRWETEAENRRNALGTAVLRLAKRGEIEKVGRGKYRAALATPDEAPEPDRGTMRAWPQERHMDG